jgi:hypothetical protein
MCWKGDVKVRLGCHQDGDILLTHLSQSWKWWEGDAKVRLGCHQDSDILLKYIY